MKVRIGWRTVTSVAAIALIGAFVTIERRTPARIDIGGDTLIINGTHPVDIGARLINRHGDAVWKPRLRFVGDSASAATVTSNGAVSCRGMGDGVVTVSKGSRSRQLVVRCRPIWAWGEPEFYSLVEWESSIAGSMRLLLDGPAKPYEIKAIGYDRQPVALLQGRATIRDTSIALLEGEMVHPRRVGHTVIDFEFSGGVRTKIAVNVRRSMIDTALAMVAGQMKTWRVPPGYYELKLERDSVTQLAPPILAPMNANCARGREGPQHLYCITKSNSVFVVHNPLNARKSAGHLSAIQIRQGG